MTTKQQPTSRQQCGTYSGYQRHRRAHENPCTPCREASRIYSAELTKRNGPGRRDGSRGADEKYRHGWLSLMEHIAAGNTLLIGNRLEGAKCGPDNAHLFDAPEVGAGHSAKKATRLKREAAERLCNTCPARDACADWAATQPRNKHLPVGAFLPTPRPRGAAA